MQPGDGRGDRARQPLLGHLRRLREVERRHGLPERRAGRVGHGLRNTGGLSVHPDNHTVLEPNMVISVEPMFATEYGWFDLEDQYLVTASGREALHRTASPELPVISA